jgi:hypothetical protein
MPEPIRQTAIDHDLSSRFVQYKTVDASPSGSTETVIATLTIPNFNDIALVSGVQLDGWAAFTVGTSGVSANLRIRQTNASGTIIAASGAATVTAANLLEMSVKGFDAAPGIAVYALTLTVGSGAAASTVSALQLKALLV